MRVYTYFWLVRSLGTREEANSSTVSPAPGTLEVRKEVHHEFTSTRVRVRAVRSVDRLLAIRPVESWNRSTSSFSLHPSLSLLLFCAFFIYSAQSRTKRVTRPRHPAAYVTSHSCYIIPVGPTSHMVPYWRSQTLKVNGRLDRQNLTPRNLGGQWAISVHVLRIKAAPLPRSLPIDWR